jgi:hypothetical protein
MFIFKKMATLTALMVILLVTSTAFKPVNSDSPKEAVKKLVGVPTGLIRIQNRWKPTQYLNNEKGYITSGKIESGWWSAMWTLQKVSGTNFYRIKNRWKPTQYLHIEHGKLESNTIHAGAWSAMWSFEKVSGTNFYRIRNRWKPTQYIHIERGRLESGTIHAGAWSAMWTLGSINAAVKSNVNKNTNTNTNRNTNTNTNVKANKPIVQYKMTFKNHGAFIAKFKVVYYINGQKKVIDSGEKAVNWVKTYYIPSNATNVKVVIKYHTGFNWSEVYNGVIGNMNRNRCFKAYGTALGAKWSGC